MNYKFKRGDYKNELGVVDELDFEEYSQIENKIKLKKAERIKIQNEIQALLTELNSLNSKITELNNDIAKIENDYNFKISQIELKKVSIPQTPAQITELEDKKNKIAKVQGTCSTYIGQITTKLRELKDNKNRIYDEQGKEKPFNLFDPETHDNNKKRTKERIKSLEQIIQNIKKNIISTCAAADITLTDLPDDASQISSIVNNSCASKITDIERELVSKKEEFNQKKSQAEETNRAISQELQKANIEKQIELEKFQKQVQELNLKANQIKEKLKIQDTLKEINATIAQLQQKFNVLQANYDIQTLIEAQKEIDEKLRKELEERIKTQLQTHAQRLAEFKKKIEQRKMEAIKQIDSFKTQMQRNRTAREEQLNTAIEDIESKHKEELTRLMNQLGTEQNPQKQKQIEEKITKLFEEKAKKIEELQHNTETLNQLDNEELARLERLEKEQQENEQWELYQLEQEPETLNNQLKEFDEQAEKRIKNIQMESALETPINLTPTVLLTRILRNIEYYYTRIYDELPLIFKDSTVVPKMNVQYILPPRLFLNYHYSLLTFKDQEEADTYISDILVPPGGTREVTITMSRISKETSESSESIITSTDEKAIQSFTNAFNKAQGLKKSLSTESEKYTAARTSFEAGANVNVKSNPAVDVNAHADFRMDTESTQRTNNKNSQDQYLDEVQNTVAAHTNEVNKKNQKEVSVKQTFELTESKESKEFLRFVNTNYEKAMKIKFYQATQLYKCFIMLDDIDLEFSNGFEVRKVLIRELEQLPLNWGETGQEPVFMEGVKRYIYLAGETKTYTGEVYHFFTEQLTRNPIYVFRLPTKDENFYGVPIRYFTQNILLDAVTTKTELDSTILLDQYRKTELETQMEQIKWNTELLKQQTINTQIKNRILTQIADIIAAKPQELDLADAINAIIATTSQGIEYIQKPFTIDYLSKKKHQNLLMLEKKEEEE